VLQELKRDVHKQQWLIDEELRQSIDTIKANAATGAGNKIPSCLSSSQKIGNEEYLQNDLFYVE